MPLMSSICFFFCMMKFLFLLLLWIFIDGCIHLKNLPTSLKLHMSSICFFFGLHDEILLMGCHHVTNLSSLETTARFVPRASGVEKKDVVEGTPYVYQVCLIWFFFNF
jgi:hypothetical protein